LELYLASVGAAQVRDVVRLFGWTPELVQRTITWLVQKEFVKDGLSHPQLSGVWLGLPELVGNA